MIPFTVKSEFVWITRKFGVPTALLRWIDTRGLPLPSVLPVIVTGLLSFKALSALPAGVTNVMVKFEEKLIVSAVPNAPPLFAQLLLATRLP